MTEVESILNSRPVTVKINNDLTSFQQLSINLLTMKSKVVSPPPGKFLKPDILVSLEKIIFSHFKDFKNGWLCLGKMILFCGENHQC